MTDTPVTRPRQRYALVDLIRDGLSTAELRAGGDRAVYNALFRTAASAMQRGQTEQEWAALVSETASRLGRQARMKGGRKERTARDYHRTLHGAWTKAGEWLATRPPPASPHDVEQMTATVAEFAADPDVPIPGPWRAVLAHAAAFARDRHTTRPALARRAVAEATGLTERTVRTALAQLGAAGLLTLAVHGRASRDPLRQKANLYTLPGAAALTTYLCRGTRPMGRFAQTYGTPTVDPVGTHGKTYGTPPLVIDPKGDSVLTITGRPEDIAAFIDALPLAARQLVQPNTEIAQEPAKVRPLRSVPTERRSAS